MFQEIEGQKPVVISRNHMDRVRPPVLRWMKPADWSPEWNFQRSILAGITSGLACSFYYQFHAPTQELLRYYQSPNNFTQLRIFVREVFKMDSFQRGLGSKLAFYSIYGLSFETSRLYLWRNFAGGYPHDPYVVDLAWYKKLITALSIGVSTSWIPVPFLNIAKRYQQDTILPKEFSRGYRGYLHAIISIARNDGLFPFIRGAGPIMAEKALQTTGTLFWLDFVKDKLKHTLNFGTDQEGLNPILLRLLYVSFGTYIGLFYGYPMIMLRQYVEKLPLNSKGELYFANYSEALWKALGDNFRFPSLWCGFHTYLLKCGPPLFATLWFADSIGLFDQYQIDGIIMPDS